MQLQITCCPSENERFCLQKKRTYKLEPSNGKNKETDLIR